MRCGGLIAQEFLWRHVAEQADIVQGALKNLFIGIYPMQLSPFKGLLAFDAIARLGRISAAQKS